MKTKDILVGFVTFEWEIWNKHQTRQFKLIYIITNGNKIYSIYAE
jgi:hypothetical protein